jgi:hypothetical protein
LTKPGREVKHVCLVLDGAATTDHDGSPIAGFANIEDALDCFTLLGLFIVATFACDYQINFFYFFLKTAQLCNKVQTADNLSLGRKKRSERTHDSTTCP